MLLLDYLRKMKSKLKLLKEKASKDGFEGAMSESFRLFKVFLGIFSKTKAYTGPYLVQIDLTNDCNNDCIGCWCRSPLLGDKLMDKETQRQFLKKGKVFSLLKELKKMGTKEIYLAGGGEPFMHPQIMEILESIKKEGFKVHMNTNFTLVNKKMIDKMLKIGIDHFIISVWAGSAKTYSSTHPNKTEKDYEKLKEMITYFTSKRKRKDFPFLKKYDVISNLNHKEILEMVDFCLETGMNSIEFAMLDPVEGKTEHLLINEKQRKELVKQVIKLKARQKELLEKHNLILWSIDKFYRRILAEGVSNGEYDKGYTNNLPCYAGWLYSRILANGDVNFCLKGVKKPVGNIYKSSFKKIWNNKDMKIFRSKSRVNKEKDGFFKDIGCWNSCDNVWDNEQMQARMNMLSEKDKILLRLLRRIL